MKLIGLSCDQASFHPIRFEPEGLTLIVGDGANDKTKEGSSNGVGKTLALGLIHHCLGANANPKLAHAVPSWVFRLTFTLGSKEHLIERSGDGKNIWLDGVKMKVTTLRRWLDAKGPFNIASDVADLTFRSLFSRFARLYREDCTDPLRTHQEPEYAARLRSLYLLGADCSLVASKKRIKLDLDAIRKSELAWKDDASLRELFKAGSQPKVRAEWLDREIPRIQSDLDAFRVAEDYRQIELEAGELTTQLRELEKAQAVLRFQLAGIERALTQQPDISQHDLLELYEGLQALFKPETLAHFDAVERFHTGLAANRRKKLEEDRIRIQSGISDLEQQRAVTAQQRDEHLQTLQSTRALDEYAALAKTLAGMEEERGRLHEFLNFSDKLQERAQELRERKTEEDRLAASYARQSPLTQADQRFRDLADLLYPRHPAGIAIDNNVGDNQTRFNLAVQIEGDDSDGINAARIICFDWVLLLHGANHSMGFVWHDNRLFADIDPKQRARWFSHVMGSVVGTGKQYIATLNTENYDAMEAQMSVRDRESLAQAVTLTLRGDNPVNKLLGIQFGS